MKGNWRDDFPLITADEATLMGRPRVRDTRITVTHILELLADGASVDEIVDGWPELSAEAVEQAVRYAAAAVDVPVATPIAG